MIIKLFGADNGDPIYVNTDHIAAIMVAYSAPDPNTKIVGIKPGPQKVVGICALIMADNQGGRIMVKGSPEDVYNKIKTYQRAKSEGVIPLEED